ncbi:MAG: hypothetical protein SGPRY_012657 [Prymnesium sp.]
MQPSKYLRADVVSMKAYTPGEQINNCTKLNTNECAWGPSPAALNALSQVTADQLRLYPSPMCDRLRAAAAEVFSVSANQVLVGNGSDDCLTIIMRSFVLPGDIVACPWPTYSLYDTLATIQGVGITHVDWLEEVDPTLEGAAAEGGVTGWHMPVEKLAISGARIVFVATPNNPSGEPSGVRFKEEGDGVLGGRIRVCVKVVKVSAIPKLAAHPNILVLRTFSKSYSMAGVYGRAFLFVRKRSSACSVLIARTRLSGGRLGLMFGDPELIMHMGKVKDSYNVNGLTQIAGEAALRDRDHFKWLVSSTLEQRQVLEDFFKSIGWSWPATDANFMLVDTGSVARAGAIYERLKAAGILVRYWGSRPELASKLRVTVGAKESNEKFMQLVKECLKDLA